MAKVRAWFQDWHPAFSFTSAVVTILLMPAMLWWLSGHFVTQAEHAKDIAVVQHDVDRLAESFRDNKPDHEKIMQLLLKLTESVAHLEGESKAKPMGGGAYGRY